MIQQKFIREFMQTHTTSWIEADLPGMKENLHHHAQTIIAELADSISQVCQQASRLQAAGQKGAAAYLCISFLHTNVLENIWEYRLDIYDEKLYFDRQECTAAWRPGFIWDYFEKRLADLNTAARTGIYANKIRSHYITEIKMVMAEQYHMATLALARLITEQALQTPAYRNLIKTPDFQISIGEYLDQGVVLYQEQSIFQDSQDKG